MDNKLEHKIEKALVSYTKFKENYNACKYLNAPNTIQEENYLKNSRYFKLIKIALFRNCIIELCKLTKGSKNNYFNIFFIVKSVKKNSKLSSKFNAEINFIETILQDIEPLTKRIINLRNDFIAHTKLNQLDPDITFKELDEYVLKIEDLLQKLLLLIKGSEINFIPILFNKERFDIISILAESKEKK